VLKPGGMLVLTCPDLQSVCVLVAEDKLDDPAYLSGAGPIAPHDILYGHRPALERGNLFMAHRTGFTAKTMAKALADGGFQSSRVSRGQSFDLWVLAYPEEATPERMASDATVCFPKDLLLESPPVS
jgi:protein O-GlcNAc transferase